MNKPKKIIQRKSKNQKKKIESGTFHDIFQIEPRKTKLSHYLFSFFWSLFLFVYLLFMS